MLSSSELISSESSYSDDSIICFRLKGFRWRLSDDGDWDNDELEDEDNDEARGDLDLEKWLLLFFLLTRFPFIFLESKSGSWLLLRLCLLSEVWLFLSKRLATIFFTLVAMTLLVTITVMIEWPAKQKIKIESIFSNYT